MCPRTCALGLSSSLLSENKKKTTKVCEIGDRESYFGALFILWIHGKNSHIRTTCKLGGHDLAREGLFRLCFLTRVGHSPRVGNVCVLFLFEKLLLPTTTQQRVCVVQRWSCFVRAI